MRALAHLTRLALLAGAIALPPLAAAPAAAQGVIPGDIAAQTEGPMLLEADELIYDTNTGTVVAQGNVFIAYSGYQLFAGRVIYDQAGDQLTAAGGVRLEEPEGNVVVARNLTLSEDLKDGFAEGVRVDTIYRTRLAATDAERRDGSVTIFNNAGYTPCWTCRRRPDQPPTWAIKARTVVYNEDKRELRFEQPHFDLLGLSLGPLPSFTIPDPTVRRKSGFVTPTGVINNLIGVGARIPYFQTLGPHRDITVAATPLSRQGVLGDVEYRQRFYNGAFNARAAGIYQLDPDAFDNQSGDRNIRGSFYSQGEFYFNPRWRWGWETTLTTDRSFLDDYEQNGGADLTAPTTLFLEGLGIHNHFEARLWGFRVLQEDYNSTQVLNPPNPFSPVGSRLQGKQAVAHPVIDYAGVVDRSVLSGELAYALNFTSVSRQQTDAFGAFVNGTLTPRFRGVEGTFTRGSAEVSWRKRLAGPLGQILTPYAGVRGNVFIVANRDANVPQLNEGVTGTIMPAAGLTYRWPWLVAASWGTQVIEPIAEIYARTNEIGIGDLPNEDAQSVVFDDTNLFGPTKFSGFDRAEGGVRANVGVRYTAQTYGGGSLAVTVGQSYHVAGRNSYRIPDILDSTGASGLSEDVSDFVGGVTLDTGGGLVVTAKGRFDDETMDMERAEVAGAARVGPLSSQVTYAFLAAQPDLGYVVDREEVHGAASLRVFDRVRVFGQLRYDVRGGDFIRNGIGAAYDDDALSLSVAYSEDRGGNPREPTDRTIFFRLGLRTLGDVSGSSGLAN